MLDTILVSTDTRQSWTPLNPSSGENPEALLKTSRGLQSPRGATRRLLLSPPASEDEAGVPGSDAAYVTFEDRQSGHEEYPAWYTKLEAEFNAGLATVCESSGLL